MSFNKKHFLSAIISLAMIASLCSCTSSGTGIQNSDSGSETATLNSSGSSSVSSDKASAQKTSTSSSDSSSDDSMFTSRDKDVGYDEAASTAITLSDNGTQCSDKSVSVSGNTIKTIEGNYSDAVGYRTFSVGYRYVQGYGLPNYDDANGILFTGKSKSSVGCGELAAMGIGTEPEGIEELGGEYDFVEQNVDENISEAELNEGLNEIQIHQSNLIASQDIFKKAKQKNAWSKKSKK